MFLNSSALHHAPLLAADADLFGPAASAAVARHLRLGAGDVTPVFEMPGLARACGVGQMQVKDEGARLGLGSFKALGGAYAVSRIALAHVQTRLGRPVGPEDLDDPVVRGLLATLTFCCATDGNHGRSVAWGAARLGARSAIFIHPGVSPPRARAMSDLGAEIIRVAGAYDDSVDAAAEAATANGWILLSDTSWPGFEETPGLVMQGYTRIVDEALAQRPEPPTHVFVQAGVGGLAAAVAARLSHALAQARPRIIVVEPDRAACLLAAAESGAPRLIAQGEPTVMAMLECYRPSYLAWRILERLADAFMTVADEQAVAAMRRLASPRDGDPAIVAGESGAAGLAGLLEVASDRAMRERLGIDGTSRVLLINTEGATDPDAYHRLVSDKADLAAAGGRA